ncbi:MAG: hypothetical protein Q9176_002275 [Flavoplaca citrina]
MSPLAPQPDHAAVAIQDLFEWVPKHCINGTNGPSTSPNHPFMPLPDLQAYFRAHQRTHKILCALFSEREPSAHHSLIQSLEARYFRVFTILILIGKGRFIEHFIQYHNLRDDLLPFLAKPQHFPTDPNDATFWESFYEKQFAYCPHFFRHNENYRLEDLLILPITTKEVIGRGGSATLYKIKLHPYYDKLLRHKQSHTLGDRPTNTYVLKTYDTKDASKYFDNEVDAFKKLATKDHKDQSLIRYFGSYKQGDTHNVLLEYADLGTLEDYFKKTTPPSLDEDIVMFWGRLFNVLKALSRIHENRRPNGFCGPDILIGWHQDVKPSNILVLSGTSSNVYDVEFKLADLGLSHFKRTVKLGPGIADSDVGGTKDYGAPECYRSDDFLERSKLSVQPLIDIWSFGCVCSEAAVWVVLGLSGLIQYRNERQQEIAGKNTSQDGSCFHDGEKVLQAVESTHDRLSRKGLVRSADHVTKPVLDQMVSAMLIEHEGRQNAIWLWKKSQKLLNEARSEIINVTHQTVHRESDSTVSNARFFGRDMPQTPPHTSYGGNQHMHGPPPNLPQYSSNLPTPGRSPNIKETLKRRPGTWHEPNTRTDMTSGLNTENCAPPSAPRQSLRTSPTPDTHTFYQQPIETRTTSPNKIGNSTADEGWPHPGSIRHSLPNGASDVDPFESASIPHPSARSHSTRKSQLDAGGYFPQRVHDAGPDPIPLEYEDTYEPPPDSPHPPINRISTSRGYEASRTMEDADGSGKSRQSPAQIPQFQPRPAAPNAALPASTTKPEKPYLSFIDAKQIRERRGSLRIEHQALLDNLTDRDHVFLIDDSWSMKAYWEDVISFFHVFAYFTKKLDKDGLEMWFTVSTKQVKFHDTKKAVAYLKKTRHDVPSDIDMRLGQILGNYQKEMQREKEKKHTIFSKLLKPVKPLSLYVLTDGTWPGSDAVAPITEMILQKLPKKQVGVQFIRFGNDSTGIGKLEYLDSGLREQYGKERDIVDTEPFLNGNLLKMLLGAIWPWFDGDD